MKLYSFTWDCGRQGSLEGLFAAEESLVETMKGFDVHFGEALGKHSEIYGTLEEGDIVVVSEDEEKIDWLIEVMGTSNISGWNPLNYIRLYCYKCDEEICVDGEWQKHQVMNGEYYCMECYRDKSN